MEATGLIPRPWRPFRTQATRPPLELLLTDESTTNTRITELSRLGIKCYEILSGSLDIRHPERLTNPAGVYVYRSRARQTRSIIAPDPAPTHYPGVLLKASLVQYASAMRWYWPPLLYTVCSLPESPAL